MIPLSTEYCAIDNHDIIVERGSKAKMRSLLRKHKGEGWRIGLGGGPVGTFWCTHRAPRPDEIKDDFRNWNGGFPPVETFEIETYLEAAIHTDWDLEATRQVLMDWMKEGTD